VGHTYKIVYSGTLKAGTDPEQFVQRFMQVFKAPEANARKLVGVGHAVVLKTKLDEAQAAKMREAMEALGMEVRVEAMAAEGEPAAPVTAAPARPAAAQESAPAGPRCPKCGSPRVSGDDCLACGVIISRYKEKQARLAAEAAAAAANPYAPPESDVTPAEAGAFGSPRKVAAGNGWRWIADGWGHFRQNPGPWIGATLVWLLLMGAMSAVPMVGSLASSILGPVFLAGFMLGANAQYEGEDFEVRHLFAGFSERFGALALVGLLNLVGVIVIIVIAGVVFGGALFAMMGSGFEPDPANLEQMIVPLLGAVLLVLALMLPLMMAYWFAPALVVLGKLSPTQALKASFSACTRNMLPFFIYGLALSLLTIVAIIPLALGFLVLIPVVTASVFTSYRDIFYQTEEA
jgi:uncharacterized membrane protein